MPAVPPAGELAVVIVSTSGGRLLGRPSYPLMSWGRGQGMLRGRFVSRSFYKGIGQKCPEGAWLGTLSQVPPVNPDLFST